MQIDLLRTASGEVGLLGDTELSDTISGVIFDVDTRTLTLEFGQHMDAMQMNVPVGEDFVDTLKLAPFVHICMVVRERMVQAMQAPLVKVSSQNEDFYYDGMKQGVAAAQAWLEGVRYGQPIHRDDLSVESSARGVTAGLSLASLRVAPQLAQVLAQEQALGRQMVQQVVPHMAPPSLGPGGTPSRMVSPNLSQRAPRGPNSSDNEG